MAASRLQLNGVEAFNAALRALPADLVREAGAIVTAQADEAMRQMDAAYPTGPTGALKRGLRLDVASDTVSATARIRNRARHAYIYERGTPPRQHKSGKSTGIMPEGKVFIPIAIRRRAIMLSALVDLVERAGFHVTGIT